MNEDYIEFTHNWTKKELADPKYRTKTVSLKTDYKRSQNNLLQIQYEESIDHELDDQDDNYI